MSTDEFEVESIDDAADVLQGIIHTAEPGLTDREQQHLTQALDYLRSVDQEDDRRDVADQLAIQNGVLFQLLTEIERQNAMTMGKPPDETPTPTSRANGVQDAALTLHETVDLDEARRWSDR